MIRTLQSVSRAASRNKNPGNLPSRGFSYLTVHKTRPQWKSDPSPTSVSARSPKRSAGLSPTTKCSSTGHNCAPCFCAGVRPCAVVRRVRRGAHCGLYPERHPELERLPLRLRHGALPAYREQRLAKRVFEHSVPRLLQAGIRQYLLEVLQHNTTAVSVYRLGFEIVRELNYLVKQRGNRRLQASPGAESLHPGAGRCPCSMPRNPGFPLHASPPRPRDVRTGTRFLELPALVAEHDGGCPARAPDVIGFGAYNEELQIGCGIFEPGSGDIAQLAGSSRWQASARCCTSCSCITGATA